MAYSKSAAAKALGITPDELKRRAKAAGFSDTESYYNSIGGESAPIIEAISKQMVELDRQMDDLTPYLSLTDQEKQAFLDKAIQQITPYYEKKKSEIEASLREGKVRTAEDILNNIRTVEEETKVQLANFDLNQANTEEEFLNKVADLTSTTEENLAVKREDYRQRFESLKASQVQSGILTSGIGAKKRTEQEKAKQLEESILTRRAETGKQELATSSEFTLDQIKLARQAAEQERIRKIGTSSEAEATKQAAMQTAGVTDINKVGSPQELARKRAESGITPSYDATQLSDLESEKTKAGFATQQELQADELARRNAEYGAQINKIKAEQAKKASQISALRGY